MVKDEKTQRCGFVALIGRPNVGKSSLLNRLLDKKLSITSRRAQTTRHQILGVHTVDNVQAVFVDTPGIQFEKQSALNKYMNKSALNVLKGVDVVLWVIEAPYFNPADERVLQCIENDQIPVTLLVNKVDLVTDKSKLLPYLEDVSKRYNFVDIIPVSARKGTNLDVLIKQVSEQLPEQPFFFDPAVRTDRSEPFLITEIVREKLMRTLGQELPYATAVTLDTMEMVDSTMHIMGVIWVERESQKSIVIGEKGSRLKRISTDARHDIESMLEKSVFIRLQVKVRSGWSEDRAALNDLGYTDET